MSHNLQSKIQSELSPKLRGKLLTDPFSRGRYATDASIYQMMPHAVAIPANNADVATILDYSRDQQLPLLARGGGTSQCGQTVNEAIVIDHSRHMNRLLDLDVGQQTCIVQPGIVLDELNRLLKPHGLWYPVDVSTASRATIGGMTANNSCGSRSIRYGLMRDNVLAINALLANGERQRFSDYDESSHQLPKLCKDLRNLGIREEKEISDRFPKVMRRVGGYNIDALTGDASKLNLSHLLVGSEGTLALFETIELKLAPLPQHKLLGVCHFPSFHAAMDSAQYLVTLDPVAVELIDRTMIELSRDIDMFRGTVEQFVRGEPEAILLVEFSEDDADENYRRLDQLHQLMGDLGFDWDNPVASRGGVVEAIEPAFQSAVFEVRKAGLNIMMSMKEDRKPISFVEDCAVELKDLAEYTSRLTDIFHKHNTTGTWYAHASVGCLHVRPVLNLRLNEDIKAMRAIAEEAFNMVLEYKGSHSGEHGDGLCRSEFHEKMFGKRMTENFAEIKQLFDPTGILNPGKIVNAPKMDDAKLFRYPPNYQVKEIKTELDWKGWTGAGGGFQGAVEMCNNNGACRKLAGGSMCPSFRVTREEKHLTRGRANSLRLALSGQLGEQAMQSEAMQEAMQLCVGCKACKRECPTGIDMARMKIEVDSARFRSHGSRLRDRLVSDLPRYAPWAARFAGLMNLRDRVPGLARLAESFTGISRERKLPVWRKDFYKSSPSVEPNSESPVVLFADTFNTWFEPENLHAAKRVLQHAGYSVHDLPVAPNDRPLCCGRTFLSCGQADKAREEANRLLDALQPYLDSETPIVGLEPSCLLSLRDEMPALVNDPRADKLARQTFLFEDFLAREKPELKLHSIKKTALLHGHCHQKAFDQMGSVETVLSWIPGLDIERIESSCCGMAGAFGYKADTYKISLKMAEASLLPAIRKSAPDTLIIADGTSCRHQIQDTVQRKAVHVAILLDQSIIESEQP
ncbi:MAG: FAD/FMN-containing dehydrogenase/Fe-S oxidoreductase [Parasphingorhabdus sp.]|jgi:FAD/FMN-containing dehydrogenase/Fe-S oxidoreductase